MAGGGRTERGSRRREAAASAVVPLPHSAAGDRLDLARVVPSGRSLLVAFGLLAAVFAAYWGARATSVFAVDRVEVRGAPPDIVQEVRAVTRDSVGTSLLSIDTGEIEGKVRLLPSVIAASVDRSFPHTLVVRVAAEHPVGVARRGESAWLVTGSARVMRAVALDEEPGLPRIWLPRQVSVSVGGKLSATYEPEARALAGLREVHFPGQVKGVRTTGGEITLALRSGREVLLGDPADVLLKLAVAAQVLPRLESDLRYLDVSVPERPVASSNPQPSG
jgi:cell division protein FtsQ